MNRTRIYLASPLGFSPELRGYLEQIKEKLCRQGCHVIDPWAHSYEEEIGIALGIQHHGERQQLFRSIAAGIGRANERLIREADMLLAVLDGAEVDSGTASEVGFASALEKKCYGLRTDWRDSGDLPGTPFNLQVLHFIERTGGRLFRSIDDMSVV